MDVHDILLAVMKLVAAIACGSLVGWEREKHDKEAGLRTHILICLGVCLFSIIGLKIANSSPYSDILRVSQAVIMGVGFLGAGTIIYQGGHVRGLTSAAGIWVLAAVGLAIGMGFFALAAITTVLTYIIFCLTVIKSNN